MEAVVSMNASVSLINKKSFLYCPNLQKVCFPGSSSISRRGTLSCVTRSALEGDDGKKSIRLTIQAESPGKSEPEKFVIEVPSGSNKDEDVRESLTHVASESAVESPEKVHEEAKHEAGGLASGTSGDKLETVAEDLEHKAERVSEEEAEHLGSEASGQPVSGLGQEIQKTVEGAVRASFESGQKARQGLEGTRGEIDKRVSVLREAAEEAGQRGSQVVEAARKSFEGLRGRLGGVQESAARVAGDIQNNAGDIQRKMEEQAQQVFGAMDESSGMRKLQSEMERGVESLKMDDPEKHRAVDPENVNKDGEKKLVEQHRRSEKDDVVGDAIREHVDPALQRSSVRQELHEEPVIGDGNEHLKDMNDLVLHDSYAPIDDDRDKSSGRQN